MHLRRHLQTLTLFALLTVTTYAQAPGRYQLLAATLPDVSGEPTAMLFRIDSATGEVARYRISQSPLKVPDGRTLPMLIEGWVPIADSYTAEVLKFIALDEKNKAAQPSPFSDILPAKPLKIP